MENKKAGRPKKTYADGTPRIKGMTKDGKPKQKKGRKKIEFTSDQIEQIENMYMIQCTDSEIADVIGVRQDILLKWLRESPKNLELKKKGLAIGKKSLRRKMFDEAVNNGNTTVMLHLSKYYMKMTDNLGTLGQEINDIEDKKTIDKALGVQILEALNGEED